MFSKVDSFQLPGDSVAAAVDAGTGVGVAGGFEVVVDVVDCTGAGGGAEGVDTGCAGVDGGSTGFGAGFGLDVMHTMKPFSSILYDSIVLSSCRILPE